MVKKLNPPRPAAESILQGFQEVIDHLEGKAPLKTEEVCIPRQDPNAEAFQQGGRTIRSMYAVTGERGINLTGYPRMHTAHMMSKIKAMIHRISYRVPAEN